jgi:integrase
MRLGVHSGVPVFKIGGIVTVLTKLQIDKAAKPTTPTKLTDGGGLYLYHTPAGGKLWRLKYRFLGKEKLLSLGAYPHISLADARQARDTAKEHLRAGKDPAVVRKDEETAAKATSEITFEKVARAWHKNQQNSWGAEHAEGVLTSLETHVFPTLGHKPVKEITPPEVLTVLRAIEERGSFDTAHRVRQRMSDVFVYAIATGVGDNDPAAIVQKALTPITRSRQPAITAVEPARQLLRDIDSVRAHPLTKLAFRLLALTALRPTSMTHAQWTEFNDLDPSAAVWRVPALRMKLRKQHKSDELRDHWVPLSTQAVTTINTLRTLTGSGKYVFPNVRAPHYCISHATLGAYLRRLGYRGQHVPHGFRAMFSTIMNERFQDDHRIIDMMLAHSPKDKVEAAYNRAAHIDRRRALAQEWADLLMVDQMGFDEMLAMPRC